MPDRAKSRDGVDDVTFQDENLDAIAGSVFNVLQRRGVLCPSQITPYVGYSIEQVKAALSKLMAEGLVEERPELGKVESAELDEKAYGISRGKFGKLKFLSPSEWVSRK